MNCTTCHTAPPTLNQFGQRFLENGYQLPGKEDGGIVGKKKLSEVTLDDVTNYLGVRLAGNTTRSWIFKKQNPPGIDAGVFENEASRSKLRGILRNSPKPLPSFAKATEGSPRLHPRSELRGIRRRRIKPSLYSLAVSSSKYNGWMRAQLRIDFQGIAKSRHFLGRVFNRWAMAFSSRCV